MLARKAAITLITALAIIGAVACAASAPDAGNTPADAVVQQPVAVTQDNPPAPVAAADAGNIASTDRMPETRPTGTDGISAASADIGPIREIKDPPPTGSFSAEATEHYIAELKAQDARFTPDTATPDQTAVINDAIGCLSTQAQGQLPDALIREVVWAEAAASASDANIVAHAVNQCSLAQASGSASGDDPRAADAISHDATAANIISVDDALAQCEQGAASLPTATDAAVRLCAGR